MPRPKPLPVLIIFFVYSVLHQRRPLLKLLALHSTPQWLLVPQQLLQLGLQDGTIICSAKRHLP